MHKTGDHFFIDCCLTIYNSYFKKKSGVDLFTACTFPALRKYLFTACTLRRWRLKEKLYAFIYGNTDREKLSINIEITSSSVLSFWGFFWK